MKLREQSVTSFFKWLIRAAGVISVLLATLAGPTVSRGATVTLTTGDALNTSSFNSAGHWSNGQAPSSANDYVVGVQYLRTPADANSYTFQGNSLTLTNGGAMIYKGTAAVNTYTITNFVLNNGGLVRSGAGSGNTMTLAGTMSVAGTANSSEIRADQSPYIINSPISGTGNLLFSGSGYSITLNGTNSYTGNITVSGILVVGPTANLNFVIGGSGTNNSVSGSGAATFSGRFIFDLSGASTNLGDGWTIVNTSASYGSTFSVSGGFTHQGGGTGPGFWDYSANGFFYEFDTSSGILSVVSQPSTNTPAGPPGFTGVKVTYIPVDDGNTNTSEYGYAGSSSINAVSFIQSALTTVSNQQFIAYYYRNQTDASDTNNNTIVIARRDISTNVWQVFHTSLAPGDITDGHDVVCFGIDGEGYMHLSWGMHNATPLNYARSTAPVTGNGTITIGSPTTMTGLEATNTYPQFLNLPNGDLLFNYRMGGPGGGSGGGDSYLNRYKLSTHTWTNVNATGVFSPFIKGYWSAATNYNAYLNMPCVDSNGNLFVTWCWRETTAYQSNHDLFYAQLPYGSVNWQRSDNSNYTLPICQYGVHESGSTNSIPEKIISILQNSSLINQAGMCLDGNNDPVIATWWAPGTVTNNYRRQYMVAFPDSNGVWQVRQVSNRTNDLTSALKQDADVRDLGRPVVVADKSNRIIVLYRDNFGSNGLTVVHSLPYAVDPLRTNWTTVDLTYDNLGNYEPVIDVARWQRDNVLDILYQPTTGENYTPPANTASQVAIVEWDAASYFHPNPTLQIAFTNANQDVALSWPSQTGWGYQLQTSTNLTVWDVLTTLNGNESTLQYIHTNGAVLPARFWRLQVLEGGF